MNVLGPVESAKLYLYDYKDASLPDADALSAIELVGFAGSDDFHTLGIAYDQDASTLYASNHAKAGGPRIEAFALDVDGRKAVHKGTIQHPLINGPNAMVPLGPGEFYVTNDHRFPSTTSRVLSKLETYLGAPLGTVVHVKLSPDGRVQARVVARVPMANGIEVLNSTMVAVSATNRASVYLFDAASDRSLTFRSRIHVPFLPDNLSLSRGKLLIAGHPHSPSLVRFTETRHVCNDAAELARATAEMKAYCETGSAPSWVAEWSEEGGLKSLYVDTEYPSSATAVKDAKRGVGIVAGLYAKGLLVWRE